MKINTMRLAVMCLLVFGLGSVHEAYAGASPDPLGKWGYVIIQRGGTDSWFGYKTEAGVLIFNQDGTVDTYFKESADNCPGPEFCRESDQEKIGPYSVEDGVIVIKKNGYSINCFLADSGNVLVCDWPVEGGGDRGLIAAIRLDPTQQYSQQDLQGGYFMGYYEKDLLDGDRGENRLGSVIGRIDAEGVGSFIGYENGDGILTPVSDFQVPLQLNADGSFVIDNVGTGYLDLERKVAVFSNPSKFYPETGDDFAAHIVLKKQDRVYSTSDLSGRWVFVGFGDKAGEARAETGVMTCVSSGECLFALKVATPDSSPIFTTVSRKLSVSEDGAINGFYLTTNKPHVSGAIGNNGNTLILVMNEDGESTDDRLLGIALRYSDRSVPGFQDFVLKVFTSPTEAGAVSVDPPGGLYLPGTQVTVVASASNGFSFDRWAWDVSGHEPSNSLVMDRDKNVIAYFVESQQEKSSTTVAGGRDVSDYMMMAVPLSPLDKEPMSIFGEGEPYDESRLRLFKWSPQLGQYMEWPELPNADLGVGYWFISAEPRTITVQGNPVPSAMDYLLLLDPGWNQVGSPFRDGSVLWDSVKVSPGGGSEPVPIGAPQNQWVENALWGFKAGVYENRNSMEPWEAYWVNNVAGGPVYLLMREAEGVIGSADETGPRDKATTDRMGLAFKFIYHGRVDRTVFLGLDPTSSPGPDRLDCMAPPSISDQLARIYVDNGDWSVRPGMYAVDVRPFGQKPLEFALTVELPEGSRGTFRIKWKGAKSLPRGLSLKLIDLQKTGKGSVLDMRKKSSYRVKPAPGTRYYRMKVVIG